VNPTASTVLRYLSTNGFGLFKMTNSQHRRPDGIDLAARSRARRRATQAIYAWQVGGNSMASVIEEFRHEQDMEIADLGYFEDLLRGVERHCEELDASLAPFLDRDIARVDPLERAVLRLAAYELNHRPDVPYRVVLNEAIEVAKRFGAEHGHTYVNGVLDKAAAQWRAAERQASTRRG
jgi:N utilization substance protein B